MRINFRSRHSRNFGSGNSHFKRQNSSWEWDSIRPYLDSDARHIIWQKSTTTEIFEKNFEENSQISLIFGVISSDFDDFETLDFPSKKNFYKKSLEILIQNAKLSRIPFRIFEEKNLTSFSKKIFQERIQNTLIILFSSENLNKNSEKIFTKITSLNEIILIFPYHFFEKNPNENTLLEWNIFNKKLREKYLQEINENEARMKKFFLKNKSHFITTETHKNIAVTLNYFFKNEYQ